MSAPAYDPRAEAERETFERERARLVTGITLARSACHWAWERRSIFPGEFGMMTRDLKAWRDALAQHDARGAVQ